MIKPAPYNTDLEAISERDACDYNMKITQEMAFSHSGNIKNIVLNVGEIDGMISVKLQHYNCSGVWNCFFRFGSRLDMNDRHFFLWDIK